MGRAEFVVVLDEAHQLVLIFHVGRQMAAHLSRRLMGQPVVEPLVIAEVEPLLHHLPFHVPVHFADEAEVGMALADGRDDLVPVFLGRRRPGALAPGAGEHVGGHEHDHVAAQAVALVGNVVELVDGGRAQTGIEAVELGDVGPGGIVGITAVGDDLAIGLEELARRGGQVFGRAANEILRMIGNPRMVGSHMVGNEIENEGHAAAGKLGAGDGQPFAPADDGVCLISAHAVG